MIAAFMGLLVAMPIGAGPSDTSRLVLDGPALLAEADAMRARAAGDPDLLARSADLELRARSRLFSVEGERVDPLGRPEMGDEPLRGAEGGARGAAISVAPSRPWTGRLRFRAGEPAFVYLRAQGPAPVVLRVLDEAGRTVCRESSPSGRALCGWRPPREQAVVVWAEVAGDAGGPLDLFVN